VGKGLYWCVVPLSVQSVHCVQFGQKHLLCHCHCQQLCICIPMNVCQGPNVISFPWPFTSWLDRTEQCNNWPDIGGCGLVPRKDMLLYYAIKCADWLCYPLAVIGASFPIGMAYRTVKFTALHNPVPRLTMCRAKPFFMYCHDLLLNETQWEICLCAQ